MGTIILTPKAVQALVPAERRAYVRSLGRRAIGFKGLDRVSLWALGGRLIVPLVYGAYQRERFDRIKGQCDLVLREGQWFLYATVNLPENAPVEVSDWLGVDLGIVNLATDSDGNTYSGGGVERIRQRYASSRASLQRRGTKGAKKCLRRKAKRETAFRRHQNHCISKALVGRAKDTQRGIALEDLKGIRERVTVRHSQRARHSGWAFAQLRSFVEYKARLAGVPVAAVDPRYSSQTCSDCGHRERANRKSQAEFVCCTCGFAANADWNASVNLRLRALPGACKSPVELVALSS